MSIRGWRHSPPASSRNDLVGRILAQAIGRAAARAADADDDENRLLASPSHAHSTPSLCPHGVSGGSSRRCQRTNRPSSAGADVVTNTLGAGVTMLFKRLSYDWTPAIGRAYSLPNGGSFFSPSGIEASFPSRSTRLRGTQRAGAAGRNAVRSVTSVGSAPRLRWRGFARLAQWSISLFATVGTTLLDLLHLTASFPRRPAICATMVPGSFSSRAPHRSHSGSSRLRRALLSLPLRIPLGDNRPARLAVRAGGSAVLEVRRADQGVPRALSDDHQHRLRRAGRRRCVHGERVDRP